MRLWTWQSKDFSIIDSKLKVDSLEYSRYLAERIPEPERSRFLSLYQRLWAILRTDQYHWYYTEEKDAKSEESKLEYTKGEILWEVKVPIDDIFKIVCSVAWNRLRKKEPYLTQAIREYLRKTELTYNYDKLCNKFEEFWKQKTEDQLWGLLLLDLNESHDMSPIFLEIIKPCTQVLLRHPVKEEWVTKNPFKSVNWWKSQK